MSIYKCAVNQNNTEKLSQWLSYTLHVYSTSYTRTTGEIDFFPYLYTFSTLFAGRNIQMYIQNCTNKTMLT